MMGLPYGEEVMIVGRTMWTQCTSVTDGRTDGRTELRSQRPYNAERRTVKIRTGSSDGIWHKNYDFQRKYDDVCTRGRHILIYASAPLGGANSYMFYRKFFWFFFVFFFVRHNDSA